MMDKHFCFGNMYLWNTFYILFLVLFTDATVNSVTPAFMHKDPTTNKLFYVITVQLGTPNLSYNLVVDFEDDKIQTYTPIQTVSGSYSPLFGGSDVFLISGSWYRLPVTVLPYDHSIRKECPSCSGTIGFRRGSFIWKIWNKISFSMGSLSLGGFNAVFEKPEFCPHFTLACYINDSISSSCLVEGVVNSQLYYVEFNGGPKTKLPKQLYYDYISHFNIYDNHRWNPLQVRFLPPSESLEQASKQLGRDTLPIFGGCAKHPYLLIDTESYVLETSRGLKYLNLEPWDRTDVISLGVGAWSDTLLHIDAISNTLSIKPYTYRQHISIERLFFFCIMLSLFVRWKMTNTQLLRPQEIEAGKHNTLTTLYMVVAFPITFYTLFSTPTRQVMRDYYAVDFIITCTLCAGILTIIYCSVMCLQAKTVYSTFILNLIKDMTFEHLLLTTMWLLMIERRQDGLATLITFLVNVTAVYNLTFHITLMITYFIYTGPNAVYTSELFTIYSVIYIPFLYVYQVIITYIYFAHPFISHLISHIDEDIVFSVSICGYMIILNVAIYMTVLYERRAVWQTVKIVDENMKSVLSYSMNIRSFF